MKDNIIKFDSLCPLEQERMRVRKILEKSKDQEIQQAKELLESNGYIITKKIKD